jgi:hypothetical protein
MKTQAQINIEIADKNRDIMEMLDEIKRHLILPFGANTIEELNKTDKLLKKVKNLNPEFK